MRNVPKLRFKEFCGEWEESHLEELTKIITKQTGFDYSATIKPSLVKERADDTVPFIQNKDFKGKHINYNTDFYIPKNIQKKFPKITLDEKCILITISGNIGNVGLFNYNELSFIGGAVGVIKIKDISMLDYLFYYLISTKCQKKIISNEKTSAHKNITVEDIRKLIIKFPCSNEQEKIANFLSSIDKKISITEEKLDFFKDYTKGVMQKIFNQELRFKDSKGNDYPEWEEKKLDDIMKVSSSTISQNTLEDNQGEYIIYGATGEIKKIDFYDKEKEYIGIVKDGAGVGRCFYCEEKSSVLATLNYLDIKENNNLKFCYYILNKIDFTKYIVGSSIPHIYFKDYKFEKIQLPCLEEQEKIANFLSSIDKKIDNLIAELENLKEFKKGLLQQMFV